MLISTVTTAVTGLKGAEARLDRAAQQTAFPSERVSVGGSAAGADIEPTVSRISASLQFRANLKTIQSADRMSDDLLSLVTR